jgi:hypothetical protein
VQIYIDEKANDWRKGASSQVALFLAQSCAPTNLQIQESLTMRAASAGFYVLVMTRE